MFNVIIIGNACCVDIIWRINIVDVKTLQEILDHASAAFTLDVYGHVTTRMLKDGSDKIQNYYSDLMCKNGGKKYHKIAKAIK